MMVTVTDTDVEKGGDVLIYNFLINEFWLGFCIKQCHLLGTKGGAL